MKYIMYCDGQNYRPIIFPDEIVHMDMARGLERSLSALHNFLPISAGFVQIGGTIAGRHFETKVYGESETLNLKSREEDSKIISQYEYGGKVVGGLIL